MTANGLDVGLDLNLVADDHAADIEIPVPPQPEMLPIDAPLYRIDGPRCPIDAGLFLAPDDLEIDLPF